MKDLKLNFLTSYGAARFIAYNTIMDFLTDFENRTIDTEGTMIQAVFFEKGTHTKNFNTMQELYDFCREITK